MKSRTSPVVVAITMVLLMLVGGDTEALVQISEANLRKLAPAFRCMMRQAAQFNCPTTKTELCCSTFGQPGCHGCKTEIPWYMEFQNKYRDRGLTVLGASIGDDRLEGCQTVCRGEEGELPSGDRQRWLGKTMWPKCRAAQYRHRPQRPHSQFAFRCGGAGCLGD